MKTCEGTECVSQFNLYIDFLKQCLLSDTIYECITAENFTSVTVEQFLTKKSVSSLIWKVTQLELWLVKLVGNNSPLLMVWEFIGKQITCRHMGCQSSTCVGYLSFNNCLYFFILLILLTVKVLNNTGPFICDKCGSKLSKRNTLANHLANHRKALKCCDLCPRSFICKLFLKLHIEKDHLRVTFDCTFCSHKTYSQRLLKIHLLQHGSKTECKVCKKMVANMKHHLRSHVDVKCPICSKICSKASLKHHKRQHSNFGPVECDLCGEEFKSKVNLKSHMLIHMKKKKCSVCQKHVSNMTGHLKSHVKVKCPVCGLECSKQSLTRHIKRKHAHYFKWKFSTNFWPHMCKPQVFYLEFDKTTIEDLNKSWIYMHIYLLRKISR